MAKGSNDLALSMDRENSLDELLAPFFTPFPAEERLARHIKLSNITNHIVSRCLYQETSGNVIVIQYQTTLHVESEVSSCLRS